MTNDKPNLAGDERHRETTHERWLKVKGLNRRDEWPTPKDSCYTGQCMMCRYYIRLSGVLKDDWGVCSHPMSTFDGEVRFEHDVCEYFSEANVEDWGYSDPDSSG